ncbi:sulfite exporter TauE/SafE family protein [Halomonas sp. MCCC 1A17488]|uniref:Probable membrane transporter protein n=1 Tax=Billgrantia sulfidoxydans TaxID=2733484 RepID=A0ABX7W6S4_9GAMM|nr:MULTISPECIES: sulfite exporter TauE/SafE family protein [Halomonas]MCE8018173.1 sulfite exporter TauE/SafE family protein [Halomonas sp. MCCC 1A17488]MCG3241506.1 sulfite exporter TauE/SafE family protein [Halomonas sp. MCCC 1A17488]QPP48538.1 sulfite exporter TauE/SafE family protein [Halomonas sp. SS10-MC5]QTP55885.1 sulfite exporter TauE/SafE family protein [Halomonas sulfidoxydans]
MSVLLTLLGYLALGAAAGTMAGLFGVGGGLIIVPALVFAFGLQGVAPDIAMHLAIGTSLATILVTGASSAWAHHQRGSIRRAWFLALLPGLVLGAIAGVFVAGALSGGRLGTLFGVFVVLVALRMALGVGPRAGRAAPGRLAMGLAGVVIGGVSALFGIGGGTLSVPWLSRCGASMTQAVGTSAACGLPIALFGALTFIVVGWHHPSLPVGATGFVMWPAFFGIVLASVPCARLGVRLAHVLPARVLRLAFAALLLIVGLRFLF